jgi:hypothetical protein
MSSTSWSATRVRHPSRDQPRPVVQDAERAHDREGGQHAERTRRQPARGRNSVDGRPQQTQKTP